MNTIDKRDSEIARLENDVELLAQNEIYHRALITKLVDALESKKDDFTLPECEHYFPLLERAREAIK